MINGLTAEAEASLDWFYQNCFHSNWLAIPPALPAGLLSIKHNAIQGYKYTEDSITIQRGLYQGEGCPSLVLLRLLAK